MAISYSSAGITITDDADASRPPVILPPTASPADVEIAVNAYLPPPPPAPLPPDWLTFAGWLFSFPPMAAAMATARASSSPQGEPATTSLPAAMDEARLRANYVPFALGWAQFLAAAQMPPAALAEIVAEAEADRLPPEFIAALQPATPAPTP